jgi:CRISPR/Cas system CSM-associated protein Csm5 (group 7 of RAMP superfamily)
MLYYLCKKGKVVKPMANKPTKRDYFAKLRVLAENDPELVAFIDHEVELLTKKNSSKSGKQTERQKENSDLMTVIYNAMESEKQYTVSDLIAEVPALAGMNTQRVAPILGKMRDNVLVTREVVKGKAYFTKI